MCHCNAKQFYHAKEVFYIQRFDSALTGDVIEGVLGIALRLSRLAKLHNTTKPYCPIFFVYFVKWLGNHGILEKVYADSFNSVFIDDRLEVFLG